MNAGSIYKNRRHHPDRVFVVTKVKPVKIGKVRTHRIYGIQIVQDGGPDDTATYLEDTFHREFKFLVFSP